MKNWKKIWEAKGKEKEPNSIIDLIKINGFDTGAGSYSEKDWEALVEDLIKEINLKDNMSILEIGCGCGAFLYQIKKLRNIKIKGIDYSENLIKIAKKIMPEGEFICCEANEIKKFHDEFDVVISHSVFNYFPDESYALQVLENAMNNLKVGGKLCVLDLNDESHKEKYDDDRRRLYIKPDEYNKKYKETKHMFYNQKRIVNHLQSLGAKDIYAYENKVKNYKNNKFRFNLICTKH